MSESLASEYKKHEHSHTKWSDEELKEEVDQVNEHLTSVNLSEERITQLKRRIALAVFEQTQRYEERYKSKTKDLVKHGE